MQDRVTGRRSDEGFMLVAVIVMVFLVLLALSVAAPKIAQALKRDRELESQHRAQQYVRAIRVYYKKFGHYPGSIDQLKKSNNQRFLRADYIDPLTGKNDWRIIHVGENKTKVKGFFGEDLPGLSGGLGSAAGMASGTGAQTTASSSAFGGSGLGSSGTSAFGSGGSSFGSSGLGSTNSSSTTGTSTGSNGVTSQSATDATTLGGGGPLMGVGSSASGQAILTVNGEDQYQAWEFLYDPRIEALYAKANLLGGGVSSGSASSIGSGLGSASSLGTGFGGATSGNPNSTNGTGSSNGTSGTTPP